MDEKMDDRIILLDEDGMELEFFVVEQTVLGGITYLLVADSDEDEAECVILKDLSGPEDQEAEYVPVEDETELAAVSGVFQSLLDEEYTLE